MSADSIHPIDPQKEIQEKCPPIWTHPRITKYRLVTARHTEVCRRLLLGARRKEVAQSMGMSPNTVSSILYKEENQAKMGDLIERADVDVVKQASRLRELLPLCLDYYHNVLENPTNYEESTVSRTVESILDRGGLPKEKKSDITVTTQKVTTETIQDARRKALQAAKEAGLLIDLPTSSVSSPLSEEVAPQEQDTTSFPSDSPPVTCPVSCSSLQEAETVSA